MRIIPKYSAAVKIFYKNADDRKSKTISYDELQEQFMSKEFLTPEEFQRTW